MITRLSHLFVVMLFRSAAQPHQRRGCFWDHQESEGTSLFFVADRTLFVVPRFCATFFFCLQDGVDYISWTFLFRRLLRNPSFYGLEKDDPIAFLATLVSTALCLLGSDARTWAHHKRSDVSPLCYCRSKTRSPTSLTTPSSRSTT